MIQKWELFLICRQAIFPVMLSISPEYVTREEIYRNIPGKPDKNFPGSCLQCKIHEIGTWSGLFNYPGAVEAVFQAMGHRLACIRWQNKEWEYREQSRRRGLWCIRPFL